jgi:hypothetical protein
VDSADYTDGALDLRNRGVITDEEVTAGRAKIIGGD